MIVARWFMNECEKHQLFLYCAKNFDDELVLEKQDLDFNLSFTSRNLQNTTKIHWWVFVQCGSTGKSFSEALILASVNPQYDKRLFIEFPEKYKFTTCCVQILFWMSKQKQKINYCTQHVLSELVFFRKFN